MQHLDVSIVQPATLTHRIASAILEAYRYAYDSAGMIAGIARPNEAVPFGYDSVHQVLSEYGWCMTDHRLICAFSRDGQWRKVVNLRPEWAWSQEQLGWAHRTTNVFVLYSVVCLAGMNDRMAGELIGMLFRESRTNTSGVVTCADRLENSLWNETIVYLVTRWPTDWAKDLTETTCRKLYDVYSVMPMADSTRMDNNLDHFFLWTPAVYRLLLFRSNEIKEELSQVSLTQPSP